MKRFKNCAVLMFFVFGISMLYGQNPQQESADVVVLMDTSGTVLPYYEAINKRVLYSIISKFVRKGDTFHLLSFNATARYEMSQQIETEADLSRVVSRFMLLYQLGQSADFLSGIRFAEQYMAELPGRQEKILIIISDGIFNPPVSSPYRHYTDEQVKTELAKISASIRTEGRKVYYIKLPFPSDAIIKDLDGTFYAGKLDSSGKFDRSTNSKTAHSTAAVSARNTGSNLSNSSGTTERTAPAKIAQNTNKAGTTASDNSAQKDEPLRARTSPDGSTAVPSDKAGKPPVKTETQSSGTVPDEKNQMQSSQQTGDNGISPSTKEYAASSDTSGTREAYSTHSHPGASSDTEPTESAFSPSGSPDTPKNPKEYTDVSKTLTENLGIQPSELPDTGGIQFNDTEIPLVRIIFPERLVTSSSTIELPISVVNESNDATLVYIKNVVIISDSEYATYELKKTMVQLQAQEQKTLTLQALLPEHALNKESCSIDVRLDLEQADTSFSQAASIVLTVEPAAADGLLFFSSHPMLIGLAVLFLLILICLLWFLLRRKNNAAQPAPLVRRTTPQNTAAQKENGVYSPINRTDKKYYPESLANKEDPRNSLNTFNTQNAAAAAVTQKEAALNIDRLAEANTRSMEGRFALLNSASSRMNRRTGFTPTSHSTRIKAKSNPSGMTELFVYNQSTSIGKRNIHIMKPGITMSIGGSKNDAFLIFLVPFPANLAQIHYDGQEYHLTILKPEFFPYEKTNTIRNCIGRNITVVSKKGYHVTFVFRGYEDPKVKLNMILTSIHSP